ncbi:uncharacterized protein LOC132311406 [Cornus florida]|uniref:uncharacterized protein LOC132311406 n=1 Tax=Cornus florida TaxID=4283 RepID=UPI0028A18EAE|nr:uncharacterized protein LOC132311406 [Cornus florida]XP_059665290.1 uncharacterized protein LOC132311406 [Cornus florida]
MLHLQHSLSLQTSLVSVHTFSLFNKRRVPISARFQFDGCDGGLKRRGSNFYLHRAVDRDSEFEVDPDQAREALRKLDQQLQSLSEKQIKPPKIKASELNRSRPEMREAPDFSGSFFAYFAFVLLMFTIFYNVLFITVIKPSIDGPDEPFPDTTAVTEAPKATI